MIKDTPNLRDLWHLWRWDFFKLSLSCVATLCAFSGGLRKVLQSAAQRRLAQSFLQEKAVEGHRAYLCSIALGNPEKAALRTMASKGWVKAYKGHQMADGEACWQLSKTLLEHMQINMMLQFPWNVFTRRANVPLEQATCFELMLTLKGGGWDDQNPEKVKRKKQQPPFSIGLLAES